MKATTKKKSFKNYLWAALIVGLIVGVGQFFVVYTKTVVPQPIKIEKNALCQSLSPECGYCSPNNTKGDYCQSDSYGQQFRGFPLSNASYGVHGQTDINYKNYINLIIFAFGLPAIAYIGYRLSKK